VTSWCDKPRKVVALIFCRGGSKGLVGKNEKTFLGTPLVQRTVRQACDSEEIRDVFVSTDSARIAELANTAGAKIPFIRPAHLATDDSAELDSWKHMVTHLLDKGLISMDDCMVVLPVTSPLRTVEDITDGILKFKTGEFDLVVGISQAQSNPYFNMLKRDEKTGFSLVCSSSIPQIRRQEGPEIFDLTTFFYIQSAQEILAKDKVLKGSIGAVEIPAERAIDIDSQLDFDLAEFLATKLGAPV